MGKMEVRSAKRKRRADVEKVILQSVAAAGLLSAALVVPNVVGALGKLGFAL